MEETGRGQRRSRSRVTGMPVTANRSLYYDWDFTSPIDPRPIHRISPRSRPYLDLVSTRRRRRLSPLFFYYPPRNERMLTREPEIIAPITIRSNRVSAFPSFTIKIPVLVTGFENSKMKKFKNNRICVGFDSSLSRGWIVFSLRKCNIYEISSIILFLSFVTIKIRIYNWIRIRIRICVQFDSRYPGDESSFHWENVDA